MDATIQRGLVLSMVSAALALTMGNAASAQSQERRPNPLQSSDLSRENLSRVAASAPEVKAILSKDPGIMVELKRWVAKEATNHGQIIDDSDLTDDAIYDRLTNDVQFRSIATMVVQRYGYLVPQVNPDSAAGKEKEFLAKERAKLLVQIQDEKLSAGRDRNQRSLQQTGYCDDRGDVDCNDQNYNNFERQQNFGQPSQDQRNRDQQDYPPSQFGPGEGNPSNQQRTSDPIERAQYF